MGYSSKRYVLIEKDSYRNELPFYNKINYMFYKGIRYRRESFCALNNVCYAIIWNATSGKSLSIGEEVYTMTYDTLTRNGNYKDELEIEYQKSLR